MGRDGSVLFRDLSSVTKRASVVSDLGTKELKNERLGASKRQRRLSPRLAFSTHQELGGACQGKGTLDLQAHLP